MKQVIVTTTINPPTEAIERFDRLRDWDLLVIGDLKTPNDYRLDSGIYMAPSEQEKYDKPLSDAIGWNCIQRRNFGLLIAHDMQADLVAVIDDDNIPLDGWGRDLLVGREAQVNFYRTSAPAFDPIGATNYPPRISAAASPPARLLPQGASHRSGRHSGGFLERRSRH